MDDRHSASQNEGIKFEVCGREVIVPTGVSCTRCGKEDCVGEYLSKECAECTETNPMLQLLTETMGSRST
jgi:hypothetical protein